MKFHQPSVSFLGYTVVQGPLQPDPAKIRAVAEWPTPTSRKQLQRFLGFANFYCRFVRDYSKVAGPLTRLTSSNIPFSRPADAEMAFLQLKRLFTEAPVLLHPDSSGQFVLEVDSFESRVGAVLSASSRDSQTSPLRFLLQATLIS